ncbi:uncharacterized protein LOC134235353 [Saccostrea cucullata]|uniref:uncharacterized protein LOC134235353 n=1 Tax=Saccostrea cuccullata TaxID=36930 RepID=UPI002ED5AC85
MAKASGVKNTEVVELSKFSSKVSSINPHCMCILLKNDLKTPLINPRVYTNKGKLFGAPQNAIEPDYLLENNAKNRPLIELKHFKLYMRAVFTHWYICVRRVLFP